MSNMLLDDDQLRDLVESVVGALLGMSVRSAGGRPESADAAPFEVSIPITGPWSGFVRLHASELFARRAAAAMFDLPADGVSLEDVRDALAEIGNILGGNIKGILPGVNTLCLPLVSRQDARSARKPDSLIAGSFLCDEEPFDIELIAADSAAQRCAS